MINASLKQLADALAARQISSVELTQLFLERIRRLNPGINAYITVDADKSLAQAAAADTLIAQGKAGPLTGIPAGQIRITTKTIQAIQDDPEAGAVDMTRQWQARQTS